MSQSLIQALSEVKARLGGRWHKEPASHNEPGFYRAKAMLRQSLGCCVIIHPQDNQVMAFINGEMQKAKIR